MDSSSVLTGIGFVGGALVLVGMVCGIGILVVSAYGRSYEDLGLPKTLALLKFVPLLNLFVVGFAALARKADHVQGGSEPTGPRDGIIYTSAELEAFQSSGHCLRGIVYDETKREGTDPGK
jgi:hypothetical protein